MKNPKLKTGIIIALAVFAADQLHKYIMLHVVGIIDGRTIEVTSFFNLVMVWNYGISFGMFNDGSPSNAYILALMAFAICCFLFVWMKRTNSKFQTVAIGMVIGGALGNALDRVIYGAVADFLDFYIGRNHWPAFNVADIAISVGVFLLVVESFFDIRKR